jgi:hypothetical protein
MTFSNSDASACGSLQRFDVVCVAALVGMDVDAKKAVLKSVSARMRKGALICVRSAAGLRGLLYPVKSPAKLLYFHSADFPLGYRVRRRLEDSRFGGRS